jgi:hypothetical protein
MWTALIISMVMLSESDVHMSETMLKCYFVLKNNNLYENSLKIRVLKLMY